MTLERRCLRGGNQNSFSSYVWFFFFFLRNVSSPLHSRKALPLPVWNDSCHNYSQVNTGRRRGWGRIEREGPGKKKREARALWLLGGECVKNRNDSKWVSSSLPVPSLAKVCAGTGCECTRANWNAQEDVYCTRRDAFDKLKRRFAYLLLHLGFSVWFKRPLCVFPHCEMMQAIAESPTVADNLAYGDPIGPFAIPDLSNVSTWQMSSLSSATSLACNWLDGLTRFGLHVCVFQCAGKTSLINLADSCGKCPTRLPVINVKPVGLVHPSISGLDWPVVKCYLRPPLKI